MQFAFNLGMQNDILLRNRALGLIEQLRHRMVDPALCARHRRRPENFTRECRLRFPVLMIVLLQKSLKSLQARLHELLRQLAQGVELGRLSAGAVTHARAKLCASAFVELNQQGVLPIVYGVEHQELVRRWRGHRLLGVDSSVVRLPKSEAVAKKFGWMECFHNGGLTQRYPQGRLSVLYDLLNEVALEAHLEAWKTGEEQMAHRHLERVQTGDLLISDRGYTSYFWVWDVLSRNVHFVSRCSASSFGVSQKLYQQNRAGVSIVVKLQAPKGFKTECRKRGWPLEVTVRFVTVRLKSGELELLVTSLLDQSLYPTEEFAQLYRYRWGQETYYGRLKGRMDLDNCSGLTVEAVEQDFAATILLSNVESVLIGPATTKLAERTTARKQPAKINRALSLHALKTRLIDLLASAVPAEKVLTELTEWFQQNPVSLRPGRKVPRGSFSFARSYHYQRYVRKTVY
jgi:Transposase DDE domain